MRRTSHSHICPVKLIFLDANLSAGMTSQPIENSAAKLPKEDSISPKQTPEKAASHCARFSKRNRTKSEFTKGNTDSKKISRPLDFSIVDGASEPRPLLQSSTTVCEPAERLADLLTKVIAEPCFHSQRYAISNCRTQRSDSTS